MCKRVAIVVIVFVEFMSGSLCGVLHGAGLCVLGKL